MRRALTPLVTLLPVLAGLSACGITTGVISGQSGAGAPGPSANGGATGVAGQTGQAGQGGPST
ncbi:MAG TPA: hypothetical protein VF294_00150, partial [Polyangiaceae bacterium]